MSDGFFTQLSGRQITIAREYDAPIALVYRVFTEPQHVVHWWGPFGLTNTIETMDARPGGVWRFTMHVGNGQTYPNVIHFHEVVAEQRLRFTHGSGVEGELTFDVEITFEALAPRRTRVTLQQTHASEARANAVATYAIPGGRQTFTRLTAYLRALTSDEGSLAGEPSARVVERAFDASEARVIDALRALGASGPGPAFSLASAAGERTIAATASVDGKTQLFVVGARSAAEGSLAALLDAIDASVAKGA